MSISDENNAFVEENYFKAGATNILRNFSRLFVYSDKFISAFQIKASNLIIKARRQLSQFLNNQGSAQSTYENIYKT